MMLALMVAMAVVAYTRLLDIEHQAGLMATDTVPGLAYIDQIVIEWTASYALTQEFALQADPAAKQALRAAIVASARTSTRSLRRPPNFRPVIRWNCRKTGATARDPTDRGV